MIGACCLLPNLGAEEGRDWEGLRRHPAVRVAARLWSHLFSADAWLCRPSASSTSEPIPLERRRCGDLWPAALGDPAPGPAYAWLEPAEGSVPWLPTRTLAETSERVLGLPLAGPDPDRVARVHDKAFALAEARSGGLLSPGLEGLPIALDPGELEDPEAALHRIEACVHSWPAWTGGRFTLKPRLGSSGRGRVAGVGVGGPAREAIRSAIPRLAQRGGAILEPWLDRRCDLSACIYLPPPEAGATPPTLLGSLEQIVSPGGGFRGHCGELDARGRVYSGHREDEAVRTSSVWLAERARTQGFFGPCGVDAFTYLETCVEGDRERLRPALELNARATMGLVSLGLVRRALPLVRDRLGLAGDARRGFLLALLPEPASASANGVRGGAGAQARAIAARAGDGVIRLSLAAGDHHEEPPPTLFFGPDQRSLREAHRAVTGC